MDTFISLEKRKKMPFIEYGGDQFKIKVVDLDKAVKAELDQRQKENMTSIIEVRPIKIDRYKEPRQTLTFSKDEKTAIYYGIPIGLHVDGNVKWRKIILTDYTTFNLSNPVEAQMWFVARFNPLILGSPFNGVEPQFEMIDPEIQASRIISRVDQLGQAIEYAKSLKAHELLSFARMLAIPIPPDVSERLLRSEILNYCVQNPIEFNRKFKSPDRQFSEVFYSAYTLGIINFDIENGYTYKGTFLGAQDFDAIRFLQKDTLTLTSISSVLKQNDTDAEKLKNGKD